SKVWDQKSQRFSFFDSVVYQRTDACLPLLTTIYEQDPAAAPGTLFTRMYRNEYEVDQFQRNTREIVFQINPATGEETNLRETNIRYGENYQVTDYSFGLAGYQSADSTVFNDDGQVVYQLESTTQLSPGVLLPFQETFWQYEDQNQPYVRTRFIIWDQDNDFWRVKSVDSAYVSPSTMSRIESVTYQEFSSPGAIARTDLLKTTTALRCDGLPTLSTDEFTSSRNSLDNYGQSEFFYSQPDSCQPRPVLPTVDVYPNPASTLLHIRSDLLHTVGTEVLLRNSLGQTVLTSKNGVSDSMILDLTGLRAGIYILQIQLGDVTQTKKVIISSL
ncbi:MAG: T9SS type A sorting domain-containing protein, partial [Bacteroidia bacterium]|nr:T9SS type A sorting domain-containing protein [Bacteroidia bacterium]